MDVIVYMQDGDLHRITPAIVKDVPKGADYKVLDNASMPSHKLRNAWKLNTDRVDIDIPKGKEIAHAIRREAREIALKDNVELIKSDSAGIPLKAGSKSVAVAKAENSAYMEIDNAMQIEIDAATTENKILNAINGI